MLTLLAAVGVLLVIFLAAVFATREDQALQPAPADLADVALPDRALRPQDVRGVRLGVAVRGYRMAEVDRVLERLAEELAERDEIIEVLSAVDPSAGDPPAEIDPPAGDQPEQALPTPPPPSAALPGAPAIDQAIALTPPVSALPLPPSPALPAESARPPVAGPELASDTGAAQDVAFPDVVPADPAPSSSGGDEEPADRD